MSIMSTPMSVNSNYEWLHRQGLLVSDKLAKEGWISESKIVHLLAEQFMDLCKLTFNTQEILTELCERVDDPAGMTSIEKEEVRRDHVEGDHE